MTAATSSEHKGGWLLALHGDESRQAIRTAGNTGNPGLQKVTRRAPPQSIEALGMDQLEFVCTVTMLTEKPRA